MKATESELLPLLESIDGISMSLPQNKKHKDWEKIHTKISNFLEKKVHKLIENDVDGSEIREYLQSAPDVVQAYFTSNSTYWEIVSVMRNNTVPALERAFRL